MSTAVSTERVDRAISAIDHELAGIVDAVLHDPKFQQLEAAWRGLAYVVERVDSTENIEVTIWSYSKEEATEDFGNESDVTRTRFFRYVYTEEYGQHGGKPYAAVLRRLRRWRTRPCSWQHLRNCCASAASLNCSR